MTIPDQHLMEYALTFRWRAQSTRRRAAKFTNALARQTLEGIAEDYDALANTYEREANYRSRTLAYKT